MIKSAINEWLSVREAQNKIMAVTGTAKENVTALTGEARKLAKAEGVPTSVVLERVLDVLQRGGLAGAVTLWLREAGQ